jgi:3-phosphoinositide dependent protein kinase-1
MESAERRSDPDNQEIDAKLKIKKGKSVKEMLMPANGYDSEPDSGELHLKKSKTTNGSKNDSSRVAYRPSDFKIIKEVGEGSYGRVYLAKRVSDGKKVAIKMLDKHHLIKSHKVDHVMREKKILSEHTHPNLIELVGTFQDEDNLYFALGFEENGDLIGLLNRMQKLPIEIVRYYTAQLVGALMFLHFNGIVHRDLKPQNILISSDFRLKLIDFGDSLVEGATEDIVEKPDDNSDDLDEEDKKQLEKDEKPEFVEFRAHDEDVEEDAGYKAMSEYRGTFVGTPLYVAPEMLKESMSGHFTDLWALGCIVYQMVTGDVPFKGKTDFQTFDIIMKREFKWPSDIDPKCKDLINKLLHLEPMKRLGAGRPGSGNSYEDLMLHPFFEGVNWLTIGTDPIPYDIEELREVIKKKQKLDIFDNDTTDDETIRQSEFSVKLEKPEDFQKLFKESKELKRGWLMKRNPWFVNQKRLFILTNQPRLMYFKDENTFRGEILLDRDTVAKKI